MNIKNFIENALNSLRRKQELPNEVIQGFMGVLSNIQGGETNCKEVFAQLDEYVEKEVHGEDAARIMPLLREHLDICDHCCDEYEALLNVLEKTASESKRD